MSKKHWAETDSEIKSVSYWKKLTDGSIEEILKVTYYRICYPVKTLGILF